MKDKLRKRLSVLLAVCMMFGSVELPVYAVEQQETPIETESETDVSAGKGEQESGFDETAHGEVVKEGGVREKRKQRILQII